MITKKTFVTISSLFFSAILLSQLYSYTQTRVEPKTINYSGFTNFIENVQEISRKSKEIADENKSDELNDQIIKLVEHEIKSKNRLTKLALNTKVHLGEKLNRAENIANAEKVHSNTSEDLSQYEINNKELITLFSLNNDLKFNEYSKFEAIAESHQYYNGEKDISDEIVVSQASPDVANEEIIQADEVNTTQPAVVRDENKKSLEPESNPEEEMIMFDYSKGKQDINQKLYERPLSSVVKNAISREMGEVPKKAEIKTISRVNTQSRIEEANSLIAEEENIIYDYSLDKKTSNNESIEVSVASAFNNQMDTKETSFTITAKEIFLDSQKQKQVYSFEYSPDYDRAERTDDQSSGKIKISNNLSGTMNIQTGIIQARGAIPTRVELNMNAVQGIEVPLVNEDSIQRFLQKRDISAEGNLILIGLNSEIIDTEIDSKYDQRFYFNKSFKLLADIKGASFVMYAGVQSGNILLRYHLSNKENAQKIIYVGDGEMYFEDPVFISGQRDVYSLTTRNLMGQKRKELVIPGDQISFFNTKTIAKKKTLNSYEVKAPIMVSGMRKYLEFKHLSKNIFVGSWDEKEIEIPGDDFIAKVMEMNDISSIKDRCIIQLNLTKDLKEIRANGKNRSGEMYIETSFLDREGSFSKENFELAEKIFVVGDLEGQINIKLDYTDGSTQYLKTFCSQSDYLLEQL